MNAGLNPKLADAKRSPYGLRPTPAWHQNLAGSSGTSAGITLGSACETVTQALREHGEDDITLVLARIRQ